MVGHYPERGEYAAIAILSNMLIPEEFMVKTLSTCLASQYSAVSIRPSKNRILSWVSVVN